MTILPEHSRSELGVNSNQCAHYWGRVPGFAGGLGLSLLFRAHVHADEAEQSGVRTHASSRLSELESDPLEHSGICADLNLIECDTLTIAWGLRTSPS